jgi:type I restriction-modification system DNA methylase subunit
LLANKTPAQADAIRIVDPACGSGSFLIDAYQHLLDWYRDKYIADGPEKHRKQLHQDATGAWKLPSAERKRILLNNIYGVDIDLQAVEVTKLSLLLKVLEGETLQSIQRELAHRAVTSVPTCMLYWKVRPNWPESTHSTGIRNSRPFSPSLAAASTQ